MDMDGLDNNIIQNTEKHYNVSTTNPPLKCLGVVIDILHYIFFQYSNLIQ